MANYRGEDVNLSPTIGMKYAASRALDWRKEFNRGGTEVGVARARDIINADELSPETVRRMVSYFARHEVDKKAEGFNSGESGLPSAGRIAWDLWGGDSGRTWADSKNEKLNKIDEKKSGSGKMIKKKMSFRLLEVKVDDQESERFFTFEGYASTFGNIDRGNDVVERGAFVASINDMTKNAVDIAGTSFKKLMPVLWQHNMDMPIGSFIEMREDSKGLYVKGILPKEDEFVKSRVIPQMRVGSVSDMSIGFMIENQEYKGDVRYIKEAILFETSLVTIPMNPKASVTSFKSVVPYQDLPLADRSREWDSAAAIERVRDYFETEGGPTKEYRQAFLYYDQQDQENFEAYKLPIADVIEGAIKAVPRAIFAAAAAISGARGGVDIPEDEEPAIIRNINRYYDKMGMESPFTESRSFRIDDFKAHTDRELESLLKSGARFSRKNATSIISVLKSDSERDASDKSQRDAELKGALTDLLKAFK